MSGSRRSPPDRPPPAERLRRFSSETFQLVTETGEKLKAKLDLVETRLRKERPSPFAGKINPLTGRRVPGPPEDKRVVYVELTYPLKTKPKDLTLVPPLDARGQATVPMGFFLYHGGVPVVDYRYLSKPSLLHLDWDDPWYSGFEDRTLRRWQQSGVMTFLYVEPYEVRHEILIRVKDLAQWMDLGLRGDEFIEIDECDPLRERVGQLFLERDRVRIDGKALRPILDRTSFVKYSMTRSQFISQPQRLPLAPAMIGVIITYLTDGLPQEITVEWDLFSDRIPKVPANMIDPAGPYPYDLEPNDNVLRWTNYLKTFVIPSVEQVTLAETLGEIRVPLASLLCLGGLIPVGALIWTRRKRGRGVWILMVFGLALIGGTILLYPYLNLAVSRPAALARELTDDDGRQLLQTLLKNVYRAFDFREEDDVYDKLALTVSGDLLEEIYLQSRKSLVVQQAGGAQARIEEVEILDVSTQRVDDRPLGYAFTTTWTAFGTVGHWGHVHSRKNQYEAVVTVEAVDRSWKITHLELLEEKRIDPYAKSAA